MALSACVGKPIVLNPPKPLAREAPRHTHEHARASAPKPAEPLSAKEREALFKGFVTWQKQREGND